MCRKYFVAASMPPGNRVMREERRMDLRYKKVDTTPRDKSDFPNTWETKRLSEGQLHTSIMRRIKGGDTSDVERLEYNADSGSWFCRPFA